MATEKKDVHPVPKKDALKKAKDKPKASASNKKKFSLKKVVLGIGHFFRDVYYEMKKVTWATKKEFITYSVAVLVFVLIFGTIIFVMDFALGTGLNSLLGLVA